MPRKSPRKRTVGKARTIKVQGYSVKGYQRKFDPKHLPKRIKGRFSRKGGKKGGSQTSMF